MARLKKRSSHYELAIVRAAALRSIDDKLDLGNGLTLEQYVTNIESLRANVDDYNMSLSNLDEKKRKVDNAEKLTKDFSERILAGVAAIYGKDSVEYAKAGGTKKSERKKKIDKKAGETA